ncbi:hypothetical protein [Kribbella sp. NPDC003557]|uniref:hypothetical protein n=1 Tax=Kribbella sp. NPDC003557 TaxID=3154449 RepID=UPI0033A493C0
MTNKHSGGIPPVSTDQNDKARKGLFRRFASLGSRAMDSDFTARASDELLGSDLRKAVGIRGPGEGRDKVWAAEIDAYQESRAEEILGADRVKAKDGHYAPAVNINPAATMHQREERHVERVKMPGRVLPVLAEPQGEAWTSRGGGADLADDGTTPYYWVNNSRAIIGTDQEIEGFFDERNQAGFRIALTVDGADRLGIRISPFVPLPEDKQWKIHDPQTQITAHFARSLGSLGLGTGIGAAQIPGGSIPIADLADFFNNVRETVMGQASQQSEYRKWTAGMRFLVELNPYQAFKDDSATMSVCKTLGVRHPLVIGGKSYPSISLKNVSDQVLPLLETLKAKMR